MMKKIAVSGYPLKIQNDNFSGIRQCPAERSEDM